MERKLAYMQLPNGLRIIHMHIPGSAVGYCGVVVRAGSRDEEITRGEAGLAHFVEHTIFKGTQKRSSWHILNRMERVGGELNAFTTKEDTTVYTAFPRGNTERSLELIADLIANSRFPESEIEKERDVVCDEIDSYLDNPADAVFDDFEDLLFEGYPLGHNILGSKQTVQDFTGANCRSWLDRFYTPDRMMVFYAGAECSDTIYNKALRNFDGITQCRAAAPGGRRLSISAPIAPFIITNSVPSHQAHTVMGVRMERSDVEHRITRALLANILGGPGMNSLLNVELRERRGLVYNVEASITDFTDCSMFTAYYGCDPEDNDLCASLVRKTIQHLATGNYSERSLAAAKKQYLGQLVIANESIENRIVALARAALTHGRALTPAEVAEHVRAVSGAALAETAASLLPLNSLTLAP